MPALSAIGKGHSKIKLNNYFINHLKAGLEGKPRLTAKLRAEIDKWEIELAALPGSDAPISLPLNRNENKAFVALIKNNAASHDLLLGKYQDMMADGTNFGKGFNKRLKSSRSMVHQNAQEWDSNQRAYDREVDSYDERSKDKSSKYHEALADLKIRLNTLRIKYNQSYMFEEYLTDQTRSSYFINTDTCLGYIPTQHKWFPNVGKYKDKFTNVTTKGTYIYDFHANHFQLHIHCNPYNGDVSTIRVKLSGDEHGKASNLKQSNKQIARLFREKYAPQMIGWTQV